MTRTAGLEPATSCVSDDAALDRLAQHDVQAAQPAESSLTPSTGQAAAPQVTTKSLLIAAFRMGAAGFEPATSRV
jgi:hypothetical protein